MKKILLILLLIPFISFGQTDTTSKRFDLFKPIRDTARIIKFFNSYKKYVSYTRNLSFAQSNYSQFEFGMWKPDDAMRVGLTLDNSKDEDVNSDYWLGVRTYFEVTEQKESNSFFLYLHPKVSNHFNGVRLNYGISYIRNKNKMFNSMASLNFENTDFILQFGLNFVF